MDGELLEKVKHVLADLLEEAEHRSMGFESKWTRAEAYFAFRDHAKAVLEELSESRALPASAIHAARVEGAEATIDTAIRAGACWCKDKKAEADRIVSYRWPSTVEKKEG